MVWRIFLLFLLLNVVCGQTSIKNFIPFGTTYGDAIVPRQLDGITPPIRISLRFPFFEKWYDEIKVYSHGLILFGNVTYILPHVPPGPFPLRDFVCAAPYWADTNVAADPLSNIFYREIIDDETLVQISTMVRNGFPELSTHRMLWAFVATWHRVPGHLTNPGRNTYQAIITTNGLYSFTIFTYNQLQWSAGAWGGYPQIGFNAGDQVNYFTLEKSFSADVITVVGDSNIDVPGQFIFHTTGTVSDVRCNSTQGLQSLPFRGSMYGDYELQLFGICFNESSYTVEIDGQQINDCQLNTIYLKCIMPMISEGRLEIKLFTPGKHLVGKTDFLSFMPESNGDLILSNHGELHNALLLAEDRRLQLRFLKNALTTNYLFRIIIYDYTTQYIVENGTFYNQFMQRVDLGLGSLNLSTLNNLTINFQSIFSLTGEPRDRVHHLSISLGLVLPNKTSATYSWKGAQQFIVRPFIVSFSLSSSYCSAWFAVQSDANTRNLTNQVPKCPCRVRTTWDEEQFGFNADPACNARKSGIGNCRFQRGARGCYRRKSTTSDAGAHCCYDNNGLLITNWRQGAGTLKAYHHETWKTLSDYRHFFVDVLPYFSCCGVSAEVLSTCEQYIRHRPTGGGCVNLLPLPPRGGRGDPHFSTLNNSSYTFNGHGEYTLLKSLDGQFEIQVRLAQVANESVPPISVSSMDKATAIVAFVIHNEDQPRVQFELFPKLRFLEIRIDERLLEFTPLTEEDELLSASLIYSDDRQLIIRQRDTNIFSISYDKSGIQFIAYLRPQYDFFDLVSILPSTIKEQRTFQGILGGFDGLAYPNGTSVSTNLNDDQALFTYAESWRTTSNSSLFYYRFQDNHGQHQDLTYRPIFQQDLFNKYANTSRYQMAEHVCHNMTHQKQCMYDVLITNDPTVSQMHDNYETTLQTWEEYIILVEKDIENDTNTSETSTDTAPQTSTTRDLSTTPERMTTSQKSNASSKYLANTIWQIILLTMFFV